MKIFLGEFEVVECKPLSTILLHLGHNVVIHIHYLHPHDLKPRDKLPLYTEIPDALARSASGLTNP